MLTILQEAHKIDLELNQYCRNKYLIDYRIFVKLNAELEVYVIVPEQQANNQIFFEELEKRYELYNISFYFFREDEVEEDPALENLFTDNTSEKINFGLKYRLHSLLDEPENISDDKHSSCPVVTFYSYKGGMGRTTTLCSYALNLALNEKKKVVIIDCDFEAPGYLNFFRLNNFNKLLSGESNGVVEYLLDREFSKNSLELDKYYIRLDIKNYIEDDNDRKSADDSPSFNTYKYDISDLEGIDNIYIFPAGNLSDNLLDEESANSKTTHRYQYLQGLARLNFSRKEKIVSSFKSLFREINVKIKPEVILIDSRTGFNDIFGTTALELSNVIVGFFGSSEQTKPGLHFLLERFYKNFAKDDAGNPQVKLILINSILPEDKTLSEVFYNRFSSYVSIYSQTLQEEQNAIQEESNYYMPIPLALRRNSQLEGIGLIGEIDEQQFAHQDDDYIKLVKDSRFEDYKVIFNQIDSIVFPVVLQKENSRESVVRESADSSIVSPPIPQQETSLVNANLYELRNEILQDLQNTLPALYAEDAELEPSNFFYRKCMVELFERDKFIVQGFKGTGKTYLYKALKEDKYIDIQDELKKRAGVSQEDIRFIDIISVKGSDDKNKLFDFNSLQLSSIKDANYYFKYFWLVYTWNSVMLDLERKNLEYKSPLANQVQPIKPDLPTSLRFDELIGNQSQLVEIERDLARLDEFLSISTRRIQLIVLYDQLDNLVRPEHWGLVVSPLIDYWWNSPFKNIFSKIFIRTDLFNRLRGTNTERLKSKIINIEWSRDEIYSYFFKLIFSSKNSKQNLFELMRRSELYENNFLTKFEDTLEKSQNQLPLERSAIEPFMTIFFGEEVMARNSLGKPYDWFYFNLNNADQKTISLRPFINLVKEAVKYALGNPDSYPPVIHYTYYANPQNRERAVEAHFKDLTREEFNEDLVYLVNYLREFGDQYKQIFLTKKELYNFLNEVYTRHQSDLHSKSVDDLRRLLEANGIIHENPKPDGSIYYFAQLYKYWLGLKSRRYQYNRQR